MDTEAKRQKAMDLAGDVCDRICKWAYDDEITMSQLLREHCNKDCPVDALIDLAGE